MAYRTKLLALAALATGLVAGCGARVTRIHYGPYLGQDPPGTHPRVFAPGRVSTDLPERDTAIPPGGGAIFYTVAGASGGTIVFVEKQGGRWRRPYVAPFSGLHSDLEPFFDPRAERLWFASARPLPGESEPDDYNLWVVDFLEDGWGEPRPVAGLNGPGDEFYPTVTARGVVYFTARRDMGFGDEDLYRATPAPELPSGWHVEALGPNVNTAGPEFNGFVNAAETILLFSSVRPADQGGGDLYASFRDPGGIWSPARPLPAPINSPELDYCPFVTTDGKYLFFTSQRLAGRPIDGLRSWDELVAFERSPKNGRDSIYWVDASVLDAVREP